MELLNRRFTVDRAAFDALAGRVRQGNVYIGCSCPIKTNPDLSHCHTIPALAFMQEHYPDLDVRFSDHLEPK